MERSTFTEKENEFFKKFSWDDSRFFSRYAPPFYKETSEHNIYFRLALNILWLCVVIFNILFFIFFIGITVVYIFVVFTGLYVVLTSNDVNRVRIIMALSAPMIYLIPFIEGLRTENCFLHYKIYTKVSEPVLYRTAMFINCFTYIALVMLFVSMLTGHFPAISFSYILELF